MNTDPIQVATMPDFEHSTPRYLTKMVLLVACKVSFNAIYKPQLLRSLTNL